MTSAPPLRRVTVVSLEQAVAAPFATRQLADLGARVIKTEAAAVEVSLFEALAEWMGAPANYTACGGRQPARTGAGHATIAPYGPFRTADGEVLLAVQNEREWLSLCTHLLGSAELAADPRFAAGSARAARRAEVNALVGARLAGLTTGTAMDR